MKCRKLVFKVFVGLLGAGLVASTAVAKVVTVDQVVVTATRFEEEIKTVPANVTVISEEDITNSPAQTVPELLRSVVGIVVSDTGANGRNYNIDLRGFGETGSLNTLVMVDGRRINQADLSGVDWYLIPKERVERIEIIRSGRGSVLYGDNAAGGVINIITKKGQLGVEVTGQGSAGSYDTFAGSATISGATELFSLSVSSAYRDSDGYRDNSETKSEDFGLNATLDPFSRLSLYFNAGYHDDDSRLPGDITQAELDNGVPRTASLTPDDYVDTTDWYIQGGPRLFFNDSSYLEVDVSDRNRETDAFANFGGGFTSSMLTELDTFSISPQLVLNEQFSSNTFKLLAGIDYEDVAEEIFISTTFGNYHHDLSKKSTGYFVHGDLLLNQSLGLSAGYRNERTEFDFNDLLANSKMEKEFNENLYTVGFSYQFMQGSSLYANYSRSFRFPVLDEFYYLTSGTINASLKPQKSDDYEIGLRLDTDQNLTIGFNLFHIVTQDEIFYNPVGGFMSFGDNENFDGDTIRQGVELTAQIELLDTVFSGGYAYKETDIKGGQYDGKDLPFVPRHQATLGIQKLFFDHLQLGLSGTYVGERYFISDFANSHNKLKDYFYLAGKISWLFENGSIFIVGNNLLNEEYAEYGGIRWDGEEGLYPSPKTNFLAGLDFKF